MAHREPSDALTGDDFRRLVEAGARCLEANVDAINALNVFPVPDGDTGINMLLTVKAALEAEGPPQGSDVATVSLALSRAALLGARGNSGVIFSQFMKGLSSGLAGCDRCDAQKLAAALASAASAGYQAVGKPVEGTMLTVMRAAAEAVEGSQESSPTTLMRTALQGAERALAKTPEQLPVLKEAGVVDAGGQGVVAFLAGAAAYLEGGDPAVKLLEQANGASVAAVSHAFLEHSEDEMYGYCTQFVILGEGLNVDRMREQVMAIAGSTVVIGDDRAVRVHAHATDPGPLLSLGAATGTLDQIKIENMDMQHQGFMSLHGYTSEHRAFAVVAVAPGLGLERIFTDLGAVPVRGGQTMNPSAQDLLSAVKRANADTTVILPNNGNVVMAAKQAAELADGKVVVIPSRNVPQGIAAMLRYSPDEPPQKNIDGMQDALDEVQSGEVATAIRTTTVEGTKVSKGDVLALLDDHLVGVAKTPSEALLDLVERSGAGAGSLVTLYFGATVSAKDAMDAAGELRARFAGLETQVLDGGQPHYHYILSIE